MDQRVVENHSDFDDHEEVLIRESGTLSAIIAVHNSNPGPAVGGCRMFPYATTDEALTDVLRLSRGMTYKSALAGIPLGGGKSVIIGDPRRGKSRQLLHAMGEFIDSLGGRYITAEDSGTSVADMAIIGERTRFVSGVLADDRFGGDPSPITALGVFVGIKEAVAHRYSSDLNGIRVAVQGVGNVGFYLAQMLNDAGARLVVADIDEGSLERAVAKLGAEGVGIDEILSADVDVLAPCAMGGAINEHTVPAIRAGIVAGAANNQLHTPEMGRLLLENDVLYAPDYVINAGGIIDIYYQQRGQRSADLVKAHVERIGETLNAIFKASDLRRIPTNAVADEMAVATFNNDISEVA